MSKHDKKAAKSLMTQFSDAILSDLDKDLQNYILGVDRGSNDQTSFITRDIITGAMGEYSQTVSVDSIKKTVENMAKLHRHDCFIFRLKEYVAKFANRIISDITNSNGELLISFRSSQDYLKISSEPRTVSKGLLSYPVTKVVSSKLDIVGDELVEPEDGHALVNIDFLEQRALIIVTSKGSFAYDLTIPDDLGLTINNDWNISDVRVSTTPRYSSNFIDTKSLWGTVKLDPLGIKKLVKVIDTV